MSGWYNADGPVAAPTSSGRAPAGETPEPRVEFGSGGAEATFDSHGNVVVKQSLSGEYKAGAQHSYQGRDDIIGTARDPGNGIIMARALRPTDTVDIGGMRTTISVAMDLGYVERDGKGGFRGVSRGKPDAQAVAQTQAAEGGTDGGELGETYTDADDETDAEDSTDVRLDDTEEEAMTWSLRHLGEGNVVALTESALQLDGEVPMKMVEGIAQDLGHSVEDIAAHFNKAAAGFHRTAMDHLAKHGAEGEAFGQWVESQPEAAQALQAAAMDMLYGRGMGGFTKVAKAFKAAQRG